ncbi:hypothetical protein TNCV_4044781 [Trichonephila clavipes]|nr:hypothetical protein TNCV_4044781 [Trichonephila clavipes]
MVAIEPNPHVRFSGQSMSYVTNPVLECKNESKPHHEPSCIIIYRVNYGSYSNSSFGHFACTPKEESGSADRPSGIVVCDADCGSNPEEGLDVCKCIVPSRHESTVNSRRSTGPLVMSVEEKESWEAPDHP